MIYRITNYLTDIKLYSALTSNSSMQLFKKLINLIFKAVLGSLQ